MRPRNVTFIYGRFKGIVFSMAFTAYSPKHISQFRKSTIATSCIFAVMDIKLIIN